METPVSFAPLAAKLAARAAEIRPAHGARNDWDKIGALLVCLVLEMLICLCEALDARAAAEARAVTAPASRYVATAAVPALRAGRQAPSSEKRAPRPTLALEVHATPRSGPMPHPGPPNAPRPPAPGWPGHATLARSGPCLPLPGGPGGKRGLSRLPSSTSISLRCCNENLWWRGSFVRRLYA